MSAICTHPEMTPQSPHCVAENAVRCQPVSTPSALRVLYLGQDAEQILHMMADLVRNHVSLGELAGLAANVARTEAALEIREEAGVEIDLLVARAVKGAHRGLGESAGRARSAREHDK